ncbi:hypothetical protein JNW91_21550 [Micromonospora sp. STR1_7]|uniref:Glycerophosphoryl diester phosphodiesterase membrane domain-containing protein n=1 Tax=Micromonospora parastrephiae TaxID=2806101 RepID=A0ABS1XY94_9ACTN|nr:proline-rich domain-containing protein [Micromonospora parastrephiae]MBM0234200.1 hypothetical protein [Micromonospora parastrephiae]
MTDQPPPPTPPPGPGAPGPSDPGAPGGQAGPPPGWDPAQGGWATPGAPPPQGWVSPPTGGYPPDAGPFPRQPWYPGAPVGWYPPGHGFDPNDALVTPPGAGIGNWFTRCGGALRRGWRLLVPIMVLTQVLPAAVLSVISLGVDPSAGWAAQVEADPPSGLPETFVTDLVSLLAVLIVGSLLIGLMQAVGWAAGSWVITRQAAGEPVGLGPALRYGARRALGLWGWTLLTSLLIGVGLCFCVLPGIYLAFALSMTGPVYLFERQNPIGRSFRMFHDRLGLLLGRVALVVAAVIVASVIPSVLESIVSAPLGPDPLASPGTAVGIVAVIGVSALLALPAHLAQLIGLLVTYAEQRAHEAPVNSARLAVELG